MLGVDAIELVVEREVEGKGVRLAIALRFPYMR
jgi:hypothetical protein